jgi:hypothetical protein
MLKRLSKNAPSKPAAGDMNEVAARVVDMIEQERQGKNPYAVALGRLGGKKSGEARMKKLSPMKRSAIAKRAAQARWANRNRK